METNRFKLMMMCAALMLLPASVWATPDGDDPPPPDNPPTGPHKSPMAQLATCSYDNMSEVLSINFCESLASATISILCDGITVEQDSQENIAAGTTLPYFLSGYGSGTFTVLLQTGGTAYLLGTFDVGE